MIKNPPIIKKVAKEMGGKIREIIPERGFFSIELKGKKIYVFRKFHISSSIFMAGEGVGLKDVTYYLFKENSIPTPKTVSFYRRKKLDSIELENKLSTLNFPVIIKDAKGSNSKGIFADIKNLPSAKRVMQAQLKNFPKLIAQSMVFGNEYRVLMLGNKVIGALLMIPPKIVGNGKNTVEELISEKQKNTRRKTPRNAFLKTILKEQGHTLKTIPKKGELVSLRKNSCLDEGGERKDVTKMVHPRILKLCAKAARVTGKYLAGLDVICEEISRDPDRQNFNILEINGSPDIYIHYNPTYGKTQDVVRKIINYILKLKKQL